MSLFKTIKLIVTFYQSFIIAAWTITICCIWIFKSAGWVSFSALFWFKAATLGLIYYFVNNHRSKEIFYYQNLGVSKTVLWSATLIFDFLLFILSLIITHALI